jgi:hypothetical protein
MASPTDIGTNQGFWFKADSLALTNGASVTSWTDSFGNTGPLTDTTAGVGPIWSSSGAGPSSMPYLSFDGSSMYLDCATSTYNDSDNWTMFLVLEATTSHASDDVIVEKWDTSYAATYPYSIKQLSSTYEISARAYDGTNNPGPYSTVTASTWSIVSFDRTLHSTMDTFLNGTIGAPVTDNTSGTTTNTSKLSVGSRSGGTSNAWQGALAEVIYYTRVLTSTERQTVDSYLQDKYGIAVSDYPGTYAGSTNSITEKHFLSLHPQLLPAISQSSNW